MNEDNEFVKDETLKEKKYHWFIIAVLISLIIIQFWLPTASIEGKKVSAYSAYQRWSSVHWSFYYFLFIVSIGGLGLLLNFTWMKQVKVQVWLEFFVYLVGVIGIFTFMIPQQRFMESTVLNLGIINKVTSAVVSLFTMFFLLLYSLVPIIAVQYAQSMQRYEQDEEYKKLVKEKKVLYEDTVLLNPKWADYVKSADPLKFAVTSNNILIRTKPMTIIPIENIESLTMKKNNFCINCKDGMVYKLIQKPIVQIGEYDPEETKEMYQKVKEIIQK